MGKSTAELRQEIDQTTQDMVNGTATDAEVEQTVEDILDAEDAGDQPSDLDDDDQD